MKTLLMTSALALSASAATAATFDFDLGGDTLNNQSSISYSSGDVDLTVEGLRCGTYSGPNSHSCNASLIDRYSTGIGMDGGYYDSHQVDGYGSNEFLTLSFSPEITLDSVSFSYFNSSYDDALFYTNDGTDWVFQGTIASAGTFNYNYDFAGTYTGSMFAIGAAGAHSAWKLSGLSVNYTAPPAVPLPAAGWMLMAGLGGLAAMKRRRKAA